MTKRNIVIVVVLILLVGLVALGIYVASRASQQDQAPTTALAGDCIEKSRCSSGSGKYCGSSYDASCKTDSKCGGTHCVCSCNKKPSGTSGSGSGSGSGGSGGSGSSGGGSGGKCSSGSGKCTGESPGKTFSLSGGGSCTCKVNGANNICGCILNSGASCKAGAACGTVGGSCSTSAGNGTCVAGGSDGRDCKCSVQNMGGNKKCTSDKSCNTNQFCNGSGVCQDKGGAGQGCGTDSRQCAGGTVCRNGVCSNPGSTTDGCAGNNNNCPSSQYCAGTKCVADMADGGDCGTNGALCASNRCVGGKCVPANQGGATCTTDAQCSGGYCQAGGCFAKKGDGGNCTSDSQCSTGKCISTKCRVAVDDSNPLAACTSGQWYCGSGVGCSAPGTGKMCSNGKLSGSCTVSDACQAITGPKITNNQSCTGLKQLSSGEPSNGAFVGCQGSYNCFCPKNLESGGINQSGNVTCLPDQGNDSCGASGSAAPVIQQTTTTTGTSTGSSSGGSTGTVVSAPYCGDARCTTNELCERTASGATTYKACTPANISGNTAPTGADVASCYNIYLNQPVTTNSCKYCGDGAYTPGSPPNGEQCDQTAPASGGNNPGSCGAPPSCYITTNACVSLTRNSSDTLRQGVGNTIVYTAVFQNTATTNPFPNIRLLVSSANSTATVVGRDANNVSSQLVSINPTGGYSYDAVTGRHTYRFTWEAANPAGVAVPAATYSVRTLTDGTDGSLVGAPPACTDNLTVSAVVAQAPNFSIVKSAAPVCDTNGDAVINYTITLTNIGPVAGTPDFVRDTVDSRFVTLGITPTSINPGYGSYSAGVITWNGASIGSVAPDASVNFTYQIRIPYASLIGFANNGPYNQALVQYDTPSTNDNTSSFDVRTMIYCTIDGVPITGIDDAKFILFGLIFIVLGFIAYRYQLGKTLTERFLGAAMGTAEDAAERLMPFEERIEKDFEKKSKE